MKLKIDIVSDVVCPWCVIGLKSLEQALASVAPDISAEVHFQPFELNPAMPPEGQDINEHLQEKYGASAEQSAQTREMIRERGAALGFQFAMDARTRIYNTFDAHRLLHWADMHGKQHELSMALFSAYFTQGENPGAHDVLIRLAGEVGLDKDEAARILATGSFGPEVRERQQYFRQAGINSVPGFIINDRHLISGGQAPEVFEEALRKIATGQIA